MKIKTKITLGVGLLFGLIAVLAAVGVWYINALATDSGNVLTDNYDTLSYVQEMQTALDHGAAYGGAAADQFWQHLNQQLGNITEPGEQALTERVASGFEQLQQAPTDSTLNSTLRRDLTDILRLNLEAIARKSAVANRTAESATFWIAVTATLCFLLAFTLLVNLPGSIANPIRELTDSIRQIAAQNYAERVHFEGHNEFGELARAFNSMAQKLEEFKNSNLASLLIEKQRIETLINNLHDPVIGLDEHHRVLFANHEALKITGLKATELIGQPAQDVALANDLLRSLIRDLVLPESQQPAISNQQSTINNQQSAPKTLRIFADGRESFFDKEVVEIALTPTGERVSRTVGHVILLKNVTPYKELDQAKTHFIATVSHELKTPLASILMTLQLLDNEQTGHVTATQRQLLDSIRDDCRRLLGITSELLNLTQAESGNIQLSLRPSDPHHMLREALDTVRNQAEQRQVQLQLSTDDTLPMVKADPDKTTWVLNNLLTNALRYAPEHTTVQVAARVVGSQVRFSVRDSGKGIEPRYAARIFDRYFQVPGSPKTGAGLGLAICREFIEAQGGSIAVTSTPGEGSEFSFVLDAA